MKHMSGVALGILLALGLTTGCATAPPPEPVPLPNSNQDIIQTSSVDTSYPGLKRIIGSQYLVGSIFIVDPKLGRTGQFTKAQVTVQNLSENRYEVEYQYQWEDSGGFAVGTPRRWKRFVLQPQEAETFAELALQKDAVQTTFTVRLVDDTFIELNKQTQNNQYQNNQ
jgi:uncharacterized protein YcfL